MRIEREREGERISRNVDVANLALDPDRLPSSLLVTYRCGAHFGLVTSRGARHNVERGYQKRMIKSPPQLLNLAHFIVSQYSNQVLVTNASRLLSTDLSGKIASQVL